jgi:hypothetical protein
MSGFASIALAASMSSSVSVGDDWVGRKVQRAGGGANLARGNLQVLGSNCGHRAGIPVFGRRRQAAMTEQQLNARQHGVGSLATVKVHCSNGTPIVTIWMASPSASTWPSV